MNEFTCAGCGTTKPAMLQCGDCRVRAYCDRVCQKRHWSVHKKECTELQRKRFEAKLADKSFFETLVRRTEVACESDALCAVIIVFASRHTLGAAINDKKLEVKRVHYIDAQDFALWFHHDELPPVGSVLVAITTPLPTVCIDYTRLCMWGRHVFPRDLLSRDQS